MTKETLNVSEARVTPDINGGKDDSQQQTKSNLLTMKDFGIVETDSGYVEETVEKLVRDADAALEACQALFGKVEGTTKLKKRIASELKFLKGLNKAPEFDLSQVQSSNMRHLLGILHVAKTYPDVTHVLKNISSKKREAEKKMKHRSDKRSKVDADDENGGSKDHGGEEEEECFSIAVDIICNKGSSWVKVIARNAQALHLIWAGRGHYGNNTLFFQAEDFLQLAKENPINYATPTVTFVFFNGVTSAMADALQAMGVSVVGRREEVSEETLSRLEALTNDDDDDDTDEEEEDDRREKRLRSESSSSSRSSASSSGDIGDESVEGEYFLDEPPKLDQTERLDAKLASAFAISTSTASVAASSSSISSTSSFRESVESDSPTANDLDPYSVPRKVGQKRSENPRVFLDISTMIAMTSSLCNGHADYVFEDKILSEQAERERAKPLLPTVDPIMKGKELFTCQMAADDFRKILGIMGGVEEKARGEKLLRSLTIVPDAPSSRAAELKESASIKTRAKVIFGTADSMQALICSANSGFVRAAGGQGVNFAVHIHQSRALTEEKQQTATKLGDK